MVDVVQDLSALKLRGLAYLLKECGLVEYRVLGRTGVKASSLCLGTANFGDPTSEDESAAILTRAVESGINLIDTGNSYANGASEIFIGNTLRKHNLRDQVLIGTKAHFPVGPGPNDRGNSRLHLIRACEDSLRRLQTDYVDFFLVHRPDRDVHIDETLAALDYLVRQGMVRYVGCSTYPAWQVMEALSVSERRGHSRFILEQPPYNLLDRRIENELIPVCQAHGLGILAWSPMAMGVLAGRYDSASNFPNDSRAALRGGVYAGRVTERGIEVGRRFVALAEASGMGANQLAVLWVKDQPGITCPIIGPRNVKQLEELIPVAELALTPDLREACDELVPPGTAVANFHNSASWMKMVIQ